VKVYLGCDPGKTGALAIINGEEVKVFPFDEAVYRDEVEALSGQECICCLEKVGAMPGQGVTSMFHFGENFGMIQGILIANRIPFELVTPQKWKKEFSITSDKNGSIAVCKRLFPGVSLLPTARCRKDNDGMAEALLMAEYARRRL
jgi:crossover junction endodeoxyribonuclease RuvC